MIFYPRFRFATPPRTGSVWFVEAAAAIGIGGPAHHTAVVHVPFPPLPPDPIRLPRVSLVRHPCDWLGSLFGSIYPQRVCEPMNELCDLSIGIGDSFNDFIRAVLTRPGIVGEIFSHFQAEYTLRTDRIQEDVAKLCQHLEIPINPGRFPPPVNQRSVDHPWNRDLWECVVRSEREFIERHSLIARRSG